MLHVLSRPSSAAALLALLALACGTRESPAEAPRRPSVLLVSLDTVRADHLGLYGYERDTTPFLEEFAEDALVFERAFAPASWTLPSHMTMLTGLVPGQHGVSSADAALSPELPLLAERLAAAGYRNHAHYACRWLAPRHGFGRGFHTYREHADAEEARDRLRETLDRLDPDEPFFVFAHFFDAHCAQLSRPGTTFYEPPDEFADRFVPGARATLANVDFPARWRDENFLDDAEVEALVGLYDAGIAYLDDFLREWFAEWERRGLLDDTLIVVTADHGEALAQRAGRIEGHGGVFQEGLHVPLVVRPPGGTRGERIDTPVALADIAPTILDACGLEVPEGLAGVSLLGDLPEERVLEAGSAGVRVRLLWPWKLGRRVGAPEDDLLFHLGDDPGELSPIPRGDPRFEEALERIRDAALRDRGPRLSAPPQRIGPLDAESRAALEALGYVGDELGDG